MGMVGGKDMRLEGGLGQQDRGGRRMGMMGTVTTRGWGCSLMGMLGGHQGFGLRPPKPQRGHLTLGPWGHHAVPPGGQKVSFAGGIDEREEDLKSLTVSEIPEDPEGAEGDEEEPGQEQDGGTGGTWGVTPHPLSLLSPVPPCPVLTSHFLSPERRHVGFSEVPSRPIGTERHSPTFPLGTS